MRKIFLTSGIVLGMICPAIAETTPVSGTERITDGTGKCIVGVLGTSANGDTANFVAQWTPVYKTVELDVNSENGAASGTTVDPEEIYTVLGQSTVWKSIDDTTENLDGIVALGETVVAAADKPLGESVTFTLNNNVTSGSSVTQNGSVTPANKAFTGFYASPTAVGDGALIDQNGALTQAGADAAYANTVDTTWYAHYASCGTPTITSNPVRPGYSFVKWTTDPEGTTDYTPCTAGGETLYAQWAVLSNTISFSCAKPLGASGENPADPASVTVDMDASTTLTQTCSLAGYTFNGWNCSTDALSSDAAGTNMLNGTIAVNTTVYMKSATAVYCTADWTANIITTTWDSAGGTNVQGGNQCTYDGNITLPQNDPTKIGYDFIGWKVESTGI